MQFCSSQLKKALAELGSVRERQQRAKGTGFPNSESSEIKDKSTNPKLQIHKSTLSSSIYICCCAPPGATHLWRGNFDLTKQSKLPVILDFWMKDNSYISMYEKMYPTCPDTQPVLQNTYVVSLKMVRSLNITFYIQAILIKGKLKTPD